jgi:hypothetical protein
MYAIKPRTLQNPRHDIEVACAAVPPVIMREVCHSVACCFQKFVGAGGGHLEHL